MKNRSEGIAIISVLLVITLLMGVLLITMALTTSNLTQTTDSAKLSRSLALAQGGRNFGQSVLQGPVGTNLSDAIVALASSNTIGNAATWVFAPGTTTTPPPPTTVASYLSQLTANLQPRLNGGGCYGPYTVTTGQTVSLRLTFTGALPACDGEAATTVPIGTGRFISGSTNNTQQYSVPYVMVVAGNDGVARRTLSVNGEYRFNVGNGSFARFALLTDKQQQSSNQSTIFFTSRTLFNGPVHTNGNFAFRDQPYFGGAVSSSGIEDTGYKGGWFSNTTTTCGRRSCTTSTSTDFRIPTQLTPPSYGTTVPTFNNGVSWDAQKIDFPTNNNDQVAAAKDAGLYINSNADSMVLSIGTGESKTPMEGKKFQQIKVGNTLYRSTDGGPLYVYSNNSWQIAKNSSGNNITKFNGMIYAAGGINRLEGPDRTNSTDPTSSAAAVASFSQITIASNANIRITGDIKYEDVVCDGDLKRNADNSINVPTCNSDPLVKKNVLGIYASNSSDILIGTGNADPTLNVPPDVRINATLMADDQVAVENSDSSSCSNGTAYILGGVIERTYGAFGKFNSNTGECTSGLGRSFTYDQRMLNGLAPPYFPTTKMTNLLVDRQVIQFGQTEQDRR